MHQIRLFVLCESQGVRRGLSSIFASENSFVVVGESGFDPDSLAEAQKIQPDVILCEFKPGEESLETIRLIKEACPYTRVFAFMDTDDLHELPAAIAAGIDGCLPRTMLPGHLVKAVDLACRTGILCLPGSLLKRMIGKRENIEEAVKSNGNGGGPSSGRDGGNGETKLMLPLTAREMEIYKLITQNYSNKEIGKKLYISQPTVKSHVSSILHKLGLSNRTQLMLYEMQQKGLNGTVDPSKKETDVEINGAV